MKSNERELIVIAIVFLGTSMHNNLLWLKPDGRQSTYENIDLKCVVYTIRRWKLAVRSAALLDTKKRTYLTNVCKSNLNRFEQSCVCVLYGLGCVLNESFEISQIQAKCRAENTAVPLFSTLFSLCELLIDSQCLSGENNECVLCTTWRLHSYICAEKKWNCLWHVYNCMKMNHG